MGWTLYRGSQVTNINIHLYGPHNRTTYSKDHPNFFFFSFPFLLPAYLLLVLGLK